MQKYCGNVGEPATIITFFHKHTSNFEKYVIEQIKDICKTIFNGYQQSQDVISIYIAKNVEDYKNVNWIMRAQWIRPTLKELFKPLPIGNSKDGEYCWDYSVISDFYKTMS